MKIYKNIDDFPNILYHGTVELWLPDLKKGIIKERCNPFTDFGQGFYLTANRNQAVQWSRVVQSKTERSEGIHSRRIVVEYEIDKEVLKRMNSHFFLETDIHWVEFVYANRKQKKKLHHNMDAKYDVVYGPLADGRISTLMTDMEMGFITRFEDLLKGIKGEKYPFPLDHQMSFHTQQAFAALTLKGG